MNVNIALQTPFVLSRRACFWVAAAVVVHTLWTSAAPAMSYPLYRAKWGLTPTNTTEIFAVYPLVIVSVLTFLGDLSDYIGRRAAMLLGLGASLVGVLLFAVGTSLGWILIGRAFMGLGVGLSAAPSAAAMVEFSPAGQSGRAGALTAAAQSFGLAGALLAGGALIQYAPFPTRLNFWALLLLISLVFFAAWFLPKQTPAEARGKWLPKLPKVPGELRRIVGLSTLAVTSSYTLGAIMLSLGSQIAHELVGSTNAFVNAVALSSLAVVSGTVGIMGKKLPSRFSMKWGGLATMLAMGFMAVAAADHSLFAFLAATSTAGAGYTLLFLGGLSFVSAHAPTHHRGGTLAVIFLVAYLAQGAVALLLGMAATAWNLKTAIDLGSAGIAALGLVSAALSSFIPETSNEPFPHKP